MSSENNKYRILFANLLERLVQDDASGKYSLPGIITNDERRSLIFAQRAFEHADSTEVTLDQDDDREKYFSKPEPEPEPEPKNFVADEPAHDETEEKGILTSQGIDALLDISALQAGDFDDEIMLGIDFGTAYSKACMIRTKDNDEEILDLPLGEYAGEDVLTMPVHSSLFIAPDGRLYFGPIAVEKSEEAASEGMEVTRVDSVKSFLIEEGRVTLDDTPLPKLYNPTEVEISKEALVTFYLGYLLYLVRTAAFDRHSVDISKIRRRVSLPYYKEGHREKVVKELSRLFSFGEVLSKSFSSEWENGFRIEDVKYLYEWMRKNIKKNSPFIDRFVEEPLAVAGSRLSSTGASSGSVCMVVDVGAGTTDFNMFEILANAKTGLNDAREVGGSGYGLPYAGDYLDKVLLAFILRKAKNNRSSEDYQQAVISLRLDIRDYKERLFKENKLFYSLPGGRSGEVLLHEFMLDEKVKDFSQKLKDAFKHVLETIHPSWIKTKIRTKNLGQKLPVILTGGGADLPMVKTLVKGSIDVQNTIIELHLCDPAPAWLTDSYEGEIISMYPQLSVSIGGAKRFLISKSSVLNAYE